MNVLFCFVLFFSITLLESAVFTATWNLVTRVRLLSFFGTLKYENLLINMVSPNNCFSYRNIFQNGIEAKSKIVDAFLSKNSSLNYPTTIKFCLLVVQTLIKVLHFTFLMSAFATAIWNTLLFTLNFAFKPFHILISFSNCRSPK